MLNVNKPGMTNVIELEKSEVILPVEIEETRKQMIEKVRNSHEVQTIVRNLDITKPNNIVTFGRDSADEIAKFADSILHSMESVKSEGAGELIMQLNKIMDKFDMKDFEDQNQGLLKKLFSKAKLTVDGLFNKYKTMGGEVDAVFITLKQYETEIAKNNIHMDNMFDNNLKYYEELQRYIIAGDMAVEELVTNLIPEWEQHAIKTGERKDQLTVQNLVQAKEMMEQRVYDLRLAENVALQSMPIIKAIQYGNFNLVRKINSAFIVTLPVFKQSLAQAIMLKRQAVQGKALSALDEKTNELLLKNAENTALQTVATAKLASGSFVQIETLEKSWETIMKGIEETKQIESHARQERLSGTQKLIEFKDKLNNNQLLQ